MSVLQIAVIDEQSKKNGITLSQSDALNKKIKDDLKTATAWRRAMAESQDRSESVCEAANQEQVN